MRRLAEAGQSNQAIKAVSGHSRDDMVAHYTRDAEQRRLAGAAITLLADAVSNRSNEFDMGGSEDDGK